MPTHSLGGCICGRCELDVLYLSPQQFRRKPQVGTPTKLSWQEFSLYLSRPTVGEAKDGAGAYSPALYIDNVRRKANLVHASSLVVDIDVDGSVDRVADAVAKFRCIVHSTYSSTSAEPRCRLLFELVQGVDAITYERAHSMMRRRLACVGIVADEGAKDASRASYAPVVRPGAAFCFRQTDGEALDAKRLAAALPRERPWHAPVTVLPTSYRGDRYATAALRRATEAVAAAGEGVRHYSLAREAYGLSRLGLTETDIISALLPAFVAAAGERRSREGERTILDAIRARRHG
jgi:hypothetical protein